MAIYHDEEFKPADMDVEIAIPVTDSITATLPLTEGQQITARDLPPIPTAACIIHSGDYDNFEETYAVLGGWIVNNGYQIAGPPREVYLVPAGEAAGVTEIQFPVVKA